MHKWRKNRFVLEHQGGFLSTLEGGLMQTNALGMVGCMHTSCTGTDQHVSGTPVVMETTRANLMYHNHSVPLIPHEKLVLIGGDLTLFKEQTGINT